MKRDRRDANGFTLIEVMIAMAVLGSALFVLLQAHHVALNAHNDMRDEVILRNLTALAVGIAEVEVAGGNLADSQEFGDRYPDFDYSFDAQPVGEGYPALYDVLVQVKKGSEVKREIHTFMLTRDPQAFLAAGLTADAIAAATQQSDGNARGNR
jgi:prepilin-type N-terminal cleavage/methylation domain-containing protein